MHQGAESQYVQTRRGRVRRQARGVALSFAVGIVALKILARVGVLAVGSFEPAPSGPVTAGWLAVTLAGGAVGAALVYALWLGVDGLMGRLMARSTR